MAFFEEVVEDGGKEGHGMMHVSSVKHASLRRVNDVTDLKKCKDHYFPTLTEEIKEEIKHSMCIVDKLIQANDLSKHEEVRKAFLGASMKKL